WAQYEDLKIRERSHFVAIRGATHPILNIIGPDRLIHTIHRLRMESPDAPLLIQRMIHSTWCGKAESDESNIRINVNEGMMILDPDIYVVNNAGECTRQTLQPKQRKMIRHVDGSAKVIQREGEREPIATEYLKRIVEVEIRVGRDVGWSMDDNERLGLIGLL